MQLQIMNENMDAYLEETSIINYRHPLIQEIIAEIEGKAETKLERATLAFQFVRDEVQHSFDIASEVITITASDAVVKGEGICFAKAHLLAALLRGMGIPTGFCYQRVTRMGTIESGHALHGLNAVYFDDIDTWFRVDPRGNKPGIRSEFSIVPEQLAYPIRTHLGEVDYPYVYSEPLPDVIASMRTSADCKQLFYARPEVL